MADTSIPWLRWGPTVVAAIVAVVWAIRGNAEVSTLWWVAAGVWKP